MPKHFFPPEMIDRCFEQSIPSRIYMLETDPLVFNITVKGHDADKTTIWPMKGNCANISWAPPVSLDTQEPDRILKEMDKGFRVIENAIRTHRSSLPKVVFDMSIGLSGLSSNYEFIPINLAEIRTDLYCRLREWMDSKYEIVLPNDNLLKEELKAITYTLRKEDNKIVIDSKEQIKERLGRFPDLAETLALTQFHQPEWKS